VKTVPSDFAEFCSSFEVLPVLFVKGNILESSWGSFSSSEDMMVEQDGRTENKTLNFNLKELKSLN
jgi:hypothetical protein